jgi:integral membrane protein
VIALFRITGWLEGGSYLLLLFVAMPLKYIWDQPLAVSIVGMAHGVLWIVYCAAALWLALRDQWGIKKLLYAWIASLLPFGPFVFDHKYLYRDMRSQVDA